MTRKRGAPTSHPPATGAAPGRLRIVVAVVLVGVAAALAWRTWQPTPDAPAAAVTTAGPTAAPIPPASTPAAYAALVGEWVRADGGYVLAVSGVAPGGQATVSYFNPRPIHVARAEAGGESDRIGLFVELRDVNYPGSTYSLAYDPATDQLKGIYYQAAQGAQYEVAFSRRR